MSSSTCQSPWSRLRSKGFLLVQFTGRDFLSRYKGTHFGLIWSILIPLCMVLVYTLVFGYIFKAKWQAPGEGRLLFATALFAGLIPFNLFAEVVTSSAALVQGSPNLVKKVVFPLEVLPLSRALAAFLHGLINIALLACLAVYQGTFSLSWLFVPLMICPFALFCIGLAYFVSALAVFVRDVTHLLGAVVSLSLFLTPIFYPTDAVPLGLRSLMVYNPLAIVVEQMRCVTVFERTPSGDALLILWAWGLISFVVGWAWFRRLRPSFADVM